MSELTLFGPDDEIRRCTKCKAVKLIDQFAKAKSGTGNRGRKSWCKDCANADLSAWREKNRQHCRDYQRRRNSSEEGRQLRREYQRKKYRDDPDSFRDRNLRLNFGITLSEYRRIEESQGGNCAICHRRCGTGRALAVDHDHRCCPGRKSCGRCIRGLLCQKCNHAIGLFGDDDSVMNSAIGYLRERSRFRDSDIA